MLKEKQEQMWHQITNSNHRCQARRKYQSECHLISHPHIKMNQPDEPNSLYSPLTCEHFFPHSFKLIYSVIGIRLYPPKTCLTYLLHIFFIFRIMCGVFGEISFLLTYPSGFKSADRFLIVSTLTIAISPVLDCIYLFFHLTKLTSHFDLFLWRLDITLHDFRKYVETFRRLNLTCILVLTVSWLNLLTAGIANLFSPNSWLIYKTFFRLIDLGPILNSTIGLALYAFESIGVMFIPLSTCLFLKFYRMLTCMKLHVLHTVLNSGSSDSHPKLDSLDELVDQFDSILSPLPLNWLFYGISCGLIYTVTAMKFYPLSLDTVLFFLYQVCAMIETLIVLFFISKWQEQIDRETDLFLRPFIGTVKTHTTQEILERIEKVMKKRVTVWQIFPIDRSLILSYIGAAITFTTLFLQFGKQ